LFQADLNRSLHKLNENPVGSIAYKYRAALRRFEDRIIWDRLHKESPVYNGDFIRTAEGAGTTIRFSGGEQVNLSENSLIRISVEAGKPLIEFSQGNISVYAGEAEGLVVSFGENRVRAAAGSAVNLNAGGGGEGTFGIEVIEGSASLSTPAEEQEAEAGTAILFGDGGMAGDGGLREISRVTVPAAAVRFPPPQTVSPAPEAAYYYQTDPPELRFQWEAPEEVLYCILEAADNPAMVNPVLQEDVKYTSLVYSRMGEGQWYWRVTPVFPAFYRETTPPSPAVPFTISRGEPPPPVRTAGTVETAADSSETALAAAETAEPPAIPPPVAATSAPPRAAPVPPRAAPPAPRAVTPTPPAAVTSAPLPAAMGRIPANDYVISAGTLQASRTIDFNWDPVAGADAYIFTIFHENASGVRQPVASVETSAPSYALEDLSLLDQGSFIWQVEAVSRGPDGTVERRGTTGENRFAVAIPKPETPRGRDVGTLYGR
jgi:hypothetical protein